MQIYMYKYIYAYKTYIYVHFPICIYMHFYEQFESMFETLYPSIPKFFSVYFLRTTTSSYTAGFLASLCLISLIYKMRIIVIPASKNCC